MASRLRINGLVRIADHLRHELAHPLSPARRDHWHRLVAKTLDNIQGVLTSKRATIGDLPSPSRRAYHFLSSIKWSDLPTAATDCPTMPLRRQVSFPGLPSFVSRTLNQLATADTPEKLDTLHRSIQTTSRRVEFSIEKDAIRPDQLSSLTRELRGWLAFFAERENVALYAEAVRIASPIVCPAVLSRGYDGPVLIHFRPDHHIFRIRPAHGHTELLLATPTLTFDAEGFGVMAELISTRSRHAKQKLYDWFLAEPYQTVHAELESLAGVIERTRGAHHDLAAAFERVNGRYFGGRMPMPHLTWSRIFTGRSFGHYDSIRDTLMVSSTLDQANIPQFVIDFLIYHELLHKQLGVRILDGRRYAHTPEFRALERQFPEYQQVEDLLNDLAAAMRCPANDDCSCAAAVPVPVQSSRSC